MNASSKPGIFRRAFSSLFRTAGIGGGHGEGINVAVYRHEGLIRITFATLTLLGIGLLLWRWIGPERPTLNPAQEATVAAAVDQTVQRLQHFGGQVQYVAVLPLADDPTGRVTDLLREKLAAMGPFIQQPPSTRENVTELLRLDRNSYADEKSARARARSLGVDGVVFGRVHGPSGDPRGGFHLDLDYSLARADANLDDAAALIARDRVTASYSGSSLNVRSYPFLARAMLAMAALAIIPLAMVPLLRPIVRRRSNTQNLAALLGGTFLAAAFFWWCVGDAVGPVIGVALGGLALFGAMFVTLVAMNVALRLES